MIIPGNTYKLPKIVIDTKQKKIRNMYVKFSKDWFEELCMGVYKKSKEYEALTQEQKDDLLLDGAVDLCKTTDIFNAIHGLAEEQITGVINHYKPDGKTFIIIESGVKSEAIIASYALYHKMPIIQVNQTHVVNVNEIKDQKAKIEAFAKIIYEGTRMYNNASLKPEPVLKTCSPNKLINLDEI